MPAFARSTATRRSVRRRRTGLSTYCVPGVLSAPAPPAPPARAGCPGLGPVDPQRNRRVDWRPVLELLSSIRAAGYAASCARRLSSSAGVRAAVVLLQHHEELSPRGLSPPREHVVVDLRVVAPRVGEHRAHVRARRRSPIGEPRRAVALGQAPAFRRLTSTRTAASRPGEEREADRRHQRRTRRTPPQRRPRARGPVPERAVEHRRVRGVDRRARSACSARFPPVAARAATAPGSPARE